MRSDIRFCRYAAAGVTSWFMIQALVNIAVVLRMVPVLGVPLPLLSYGGVRAGGQPDGARRAARLRAPGAGQSRVPARAVAARRERALVTTAAGRG